MHVIFFNANLHRNLKKLSNSWSTLSVFFFMTWMRTCHLCMHIYKADSKANNISINFMCTHAEQQVDSFHQYFRSAASGLNLLDALILSSILSLQGWSITLLTVTRRRICFSFVLWGALHWFRRIKLLRPHRTETKTCDGI